MPWWVAQATRSIVPTFAADQFRSVGRQREQRMLLKAFERVRVGRCVQVIAILGAPGIRKSRLVGELASYIDAKSQLTVWRVGRVLAYVSM